MRCWICAWTPGARVGKLCRLSCGVPIEGSDPGIVILRRKDDPAELKIAGFVEALREGHVAPDALGLALLDEHAGQLLHGAARELGEAFLLKQNAAICDAVAWALPMIAVLPSVPGAVEPLIRAATSSRAVSIDFPNLGNQCVTSA